MKMPLIGWKPIGNDRNIASARLRCFEPLDWLQRNGLSVEIFRPENQDRYDVLVLQKCSSAEDVALAAAAKARGARVIYDLCDNLFYFAAGDTRYSERAERTRELAAHSDLITVSTPAMQAVIEKETGKTATVIPDPVIIPRQWSRWQLRAALGAWRHRLSRRSKSGPLEIIWYGHSTLNAAEGGLRDLLHIAPILEKLHHEFPLRLTVISNGPEIFESEIRPLRFPTRYIAWKHYAHFCSIAPEHDVCVIPFSRNPVTECKSSNRLCLSLYLGVAVVADSIPSYREFSPFCQLDNWEKGLREYAASPVLREKHVREGRAYVEANYMLPHIARQWQNVFQQS